MGENDCPQPLEPGHHRKSGSTWSSGLPWSAVISPVVAGVAFDESIVRGIRAGLTKINVSTHMNAQFTGAIREYLTANPAAVDPRRYVAAGRDAVRHEAARLLRLFASTAKETR